MGQAGHSRQTRCEISGLVWAAYDFRRMRATAPQILCSLSVDQEVVGGTTLPASGSRRGVDMNASNLPNVLSIALVVGFAIWAVLIAALITALQ